MKGTIVNTVAVLAGTACGLVLKRGIPVKYQQTIMHGLALAVFIIGAQMAFKTQNMLIVILSLVSGAIAGEALNLDGWLNRLGEWLSIKIGPGYGDVGKGFITASLVFCVGAMAVVGSIQDGLTGDPSTLYAKSMLDGVTSTVFAAGMGVGVGLASIPVLLYQGGITLLAEQLGPVLSEGMIREMTAVGGVLIIGISLAMLEIAKIRVANLLPAIPAAALIVWLWPA